MDPLLGFDARDDSKHESVGRMTKKIDEQRLHLRGKSQV